MGGGVSKRRKAKYVVEPEPEAEKAAEVLFSLVIDLDGSGNLESLQYRDNHPDAESAAREFVALHALHDTQLAQIRAAVQRKIDLRNAMLAEEEARRLKAEADALLPHLHEPDGKPHGRPDGHWHAPGFQLPSWEHPEDRSHAATSPAGALGLHHIQSVKTLRDLFDAARYGKQKQLLECLLRGQLRGQQINSCGEDGYTPLHLAARVGNLTMVEALVAHGADVTKRRPPEGMTPTYVACMHGHLSIVKFLCDPGPRGCGTDPEAAPDHGKSLTPFGAACVAGRLDVVKYLVEERGVNPDKWREAAVYGRLPKQILMYLTDWISPDACGAASVALRNRLRKLEYETEADHLKEVSNNALVWSRTVAPQCSSGQPTDQLQRSHADILQMVERIDATPVESRQLVTARQHLAFAQAIDEGRKESWKVLQKFLSQRNMGERVKKRANAFKKHNIYSLGHLQELIWEDPTPRRGVLTKIFRGTKENSRETDLEGLGVLKARVKEGTRPFDKLGLYRLGPDEELRALFDELDADGSGALDKTELADLVPLAQVARERGSNGGKGGQNDPASAPLTAAEASALLKEIDEDGSGDIDYGEFKRYWKRAQGYGGRPKLMIDDEAALAAKAAEALGGAAIPNRLSSRGSSRVSSRASSRGSVKGSASQRGKTPKTPALKTSDASGAVGGGHRDSSPQKSTRGGSTSPSKRAGSKSPGKKKGGSSSPAKSPGKKKKQTSGKTSPANSRGGLTSPNKGSSKSPETRPSSRPGTSSSRPSTSSSRPGTRGSGKSGGRKGSRASTPGPAPAPLPSRLTELLYKRYELAMASVNHTNGLRVLYELTRQAPTPAEWMEVSILERILGHGHPQPWMSGGEAPTLARHDVVWRKEAEDRAREGAALFKDRVMKQKMERIRKRKKLVKETTAELALVLEAAGKECNFETIEPLKAVIDKATSLNEKTLLADLTAAERALLRLQAEEKLSQALHTARTNRPIVSRDAIVVLLGCEQECKTRGTKERGEIMTVSGNLRPTLEAEVKLGKALKSAGRIKIARDRPRDLELITSLQTTINTGIKRKVEGDLLREARAVCTKLCLEIELSRAVRLPLAYESLPHVGGEVPSRGPTPSSAPRPATSSTRPGTSGSRASTAASEHDDIGPPPEAPLGSKMVEETDMDAVKMILFHMRQPPPPPLPTMPPPEPPPPPKKKKDAAGGRKKERPAIVLLANHNFIPAEEHESRCLTLRKDSEVILDEGMGEDGEWWLGHLSSKPKEIRAFPRSYVRLKSDSPPPPPPPSTARCVKQTPLRETQSTDSKKLGVVEVNQKVQVLQKVKTENGAVMARVLLLDDEFAQAQAMSEPSESEDDPDEEEVEEVLEELVDMVEEVAGVVEALLGHVVIEVEGALDEQQGRLLIEPSSGAEVLSLVPVDGRIGALIPVAGGEDGHGGNAAVEEEQEEQEDGGDDEEEDSENESEPAPLKPERVGWATYVGPPKKKKKKKFPGEPNFVDRIFTVILERSDVGIERFFNGGAFTVSAAKASAMDGVLSAWDHRLEDLIDRATIAGVDETGDLLRDARMARAQRAAWVRIAAEEAAEEHALATDVDKLD